MATGDKLVNLDDLKVVKDYEDGEIADLKSALIPENCYSFPFLRSDGTSQGVTFTWVDDYTVHAESSAASTGEANRNLILASTGFVENMKPGDTINIDISQSGTPEMKIQVFKNGTALEKESTTSFSYTIPNDATGVLIRLRGPSGKVYDTNVTVHIYNDKLPNFTVPQSEFIPTNIGKELPSNVDFNTLTDNNIWQLDNGKSYVNSPISSARLGMLSVIHAKSRVWQIVVAYNTSDYFTNQVYARNTTNTSGTSWTDWKVISMLSDVILKSNSSNAYTTAHTLNLNELTDNNIWLIDSDHEYTNKPSGMTGAGFLIVMKTANHCCQIAYQYTGGKQWKRRGNGTGETWETWQDLAGTINNYTNEYYTYQYENTYNITCSPTITTDTNNYISAPGSGVTPSEITAAINTMLNTVGVCHLGPGDFYVTGIEIPNGAMLSGSGNTTRIILDSSVTTGYAVKLNDLGSVENCTILGQTTAYTRQETVGNRHGIYFQGTATFGGGETGRKYRSTISDVVIGNFNGGGITCIDTGEGTSNNLVVTNVHIYRCDAGINIAHLSEFHRFTNVSVTICYYGCICNGGNCNFTNCNFSSCMIGVLMDDSASQSVNNSHGTFSACTICHSGSSNDGIAIKLLGLDAGEIFEGFQIFYGSVYIDGCTGIRICNSNFGASTPITVKNSTVVVFSDCTMLSTSASPLTNDSAGNTALKFHDCYIRDGSVYDPTV